MIAHLTLVPGMRWMLGLFEAGLFPGVNYYLSWSALLAYAVASMKLTPHVQLVQAFRIRYPRRSLLLGSDGKLFPCLLRQRGTHTHAPSSQVSGMWLRVPGYDLLDLTNFGTQAPSAGCSL